MGTSTDAYLVWGIQIEDGWGQGLQETEDDDATPTIEYRLAYSGDVVDGIRAVAHCSGEFPMYILSDGEHKSAYRGNPESIDPRRLKPGDAQALREFAAKHDIPLTGEAVWWLCSWWS